MSNNFMKAPGNIVKHLRPAAGRSLPDDPWEAMALTRGPYFSVTESQYRAIEAMAIEHDTDILVLHGRQVTFGEWDSGERAIVPLCRSI